MNKLGWLIYWTARITGYLVHNWERGWNTIHRTDWKEPAKW